jgi:hypothetical protein
VRPACRLGRGSRRAPSPRATGDATLYGNAAFARVRSANRHEHVIADAVPRDRDTVAPCVTHPVDAGHPVVHRPAHPVVRHPVRGVVHHLVRGFVHGPGPSVAHRAVRRHPEASVGLAVPPGAARSTAPDRPATDAAPIG